jgi:hypothetical protein
MGRNKEVWRIASRSDDATFDMNSLLNGGQAIPVHGFCLIGAWLSLILLKMSAETLHLLTAFKENQQGLGDDGLFYNELGVSSSAFAPTGLSTMSGQKPNQEGHQSVIT